MATRLVVKRKVYPFIYAVVIKCIKERAQDAKGNEMVQSFLIFNESIDYRVEIFVCRDLELDVKGTTELGL